MKTRLFAVGGALAIIAALAAMMVTAALAQTPGGSGPGGMMQPEATPGRGPGGMMDPGSGVQPQATPGPWSGPGGMMGPEGTVPQPGSGQANPQQEPRGPGWGPGGMMGPGGWSGSGAYGPGMMGGYGPGMMGGYGAGGMGGMMGGPYLPTVNPIDEARAKSAVDGYLESLGDQNLTFDEIHSFASNYYVPVKELGTENYAFELIVDRFGGTVWPEPGPNMMWNAKYGMMAGTMMGPGWNWNQQNTQFTPTVQTPVEEDQALENARQFLGSYLPGANAGEVHAFYGYRTIEVMREDQRVGMLSVNGYNGAVWYHTWHGQPLQEEE